jgi:excinuclease UvrABC nuclease subunit
MFKVSETKYKNLKNICLPSFTKQIIKKKIRNMVFEITKCIATTTTGEKEDANCWENKLIKFVCLCAQLLRKKLLN